VECELKASFIHFLPKFYGLASEDPPKNLKEFHIVCIIMRATRVPKEHQAKGVPIFLARYNERLVVLTITRITN